MFRARIRKQRSLCGSLALLCIVIAGACTSTADKVFRVEIMDQDDRAKFIEILETTNRSFSVDTEGRLLVQAESIEELQSAMAEYSEWQRAKWDVVDADAVDGR